MKLLSSALLCALAAACGHGHDHEALERVELTTRGEASALVAVWTDGAGWTDAGGGAIDELPDPVDVAGEGLMPLAAGGQHASLAVRFFNHDGDEIPVGTLAQDPATGERDCSEYHARYAPIEDETDVIAWPNIRHPDSGAGSFQFALRSDGDLVGIFHCDHVDIYPESPGTVEIEVLLFHLEHADDRTNRLTVRVEGGA
jgi:hypothetical protein